MNWAYIWASTKEIQAWASVPIPQTKKTPEKMRLTHLLFLALFFPWRAWFNWRTPIYKRIKETIRKANWQSNMQCQMTFFLKSSCPHCSSAFFTWTADRSPHGFPLPLPARWCVNSSLWPASCADNKWKNTGFTKVMKTLYRIQVLLQKGLCGLWSPKMGAS